MKSYIPLSFLLSLGYSQAQRTYYLDTNCPDGVAAALNDAKGMAATAITLNGGDEKARVKQVLDVFFSGASVGELAAAFCRTK